VKIIMKTNIKYFCIILILLNPLTELTAAVDIPAGYLSSYSLNSAGTTYNLLGNISANGTAFSVAANNITLALRHIIWVLFYNIKII
jgi:hypothetical protein